jgi:hypothetical protein
MSSNEAKNEKAALARAAPNFYRIWRVKILHFPPTPFRSLRLAPAFVSATRGKIADLDLDPTFGVKRKPRSRAPNAPEKARKRA